MTIVVEDGTGVAGANSYVTDVDALNYFVARGRQDEWTQQSNITVREGWLVQAGDYLNGLSWRGYRVSPTQSMALPRTLGLFRYQIRDDLTPLGVALDLFSRGIPLGVKQAQILLALQAAGGPLVPAVAGPVVSKETKSLAGVGEKSTEYDVPTSSVPTYLFLAGLIGHYLESAPGSTIQVTRRFA